MPLQTLYRSRIHEVKGIFTTN